MLIQLREGLRSSKVLKYVFVGVIAVPFAFFGVGSYFSASVNTHAATVDGEEVSMQQFESALLQQQDRMRQMFGGAVPDGLLEDSQLREGALEQLVGQRLMVQRVRDQHYTVSDAELAKAIRERDEFQIDGVFDQARYEQILSANRVSNTAFEETTRRDQGLVQLFNAVTASAFVLPTEAKQSSDLENQERELVLAELDVAALAEASEVADEELAQHYKDNEARYMRPEQFKVSYIELDKKRLGEQAVVGDAAIEAEYASRADEFVTAEKRDASHILLSLEEGAEQNTVDEVMAKAALLREQLVEGSDFAVLAKEHSSDQGTADNGGSLGLFAKGAMVEAFDTSVFSLKVGVISEPVRTPFGVHIIKLNAIEKSKVKSLENVRDQLKKELAQQQVASVFFEKQDTLATESFENEGTLDTAADALDVLVQQSEWFSEESRVDIGQYAQVRAAVLSADVLSAGLNSPVLEIADTHAIVLRLDKRKPEELKPLDEVRDQIVTELKNQKGREAAQEKADLLLAEVRDGKAFADAAVAQGLEKPADPVWSKRENTEIERAVLSKAFSLPYVVSGEPQWEKVNSTAGNPVVFGLKAVRVATAVEDGSESLMADSRLVQQQGNAAFQALKVGMRETADVSINTKAINPSIE